QMSLPGVSVIVRYRLFAQAVFTGLQRCERQYLVVIALRAVAARTHVDYVDVASGHQFAVIGDDSRNTELFGTLLGQLTAQIADRYQFAERGAGKARQMRARRPTARPDNRNSQFLSHRTSFRLIAMRKVLQRVISSATESWSARA